MTRPAAASALRTDTGFTVFDLNRTYPIDPAELSVHGPGHALCGLGVYRAAAC